MLFKVFSLFALLGAASAQSCGNLDVRVDHGGKCGSDNAERVHLNLAIFEVMVDAIADETGMDVGDVINKGHFVSSGNGNGNGNGNANGKGKGNNRRLAETDYSVFERQLGIAEKIENQRQLWDCGYTVQECETTLQGNWMICCRLCDFPGFCRRRELLEEQLEDHAIRTGRDLQDVKSKICEDIKDKIRNGSGCMNGATVFCE